MEILFNAFFEGPVRDIFRLMFAYWFVWMPIALASIAWEMWVTYVRTNWLANSPRTLLEIKIPQEIAKGPQAMEVVLNAIHSAGGGNMKMRYWHGLVPTWYSLEIASINGKVHFYVNTQRFFKNLLESQIYGQYTEAEIAEVDDYTKVLPKDLPNNDWSVWGAEFDLTKDDAYPIKTYIDYELHLVKEEEEKVDPLSSILEFMGTLREGEQLWFQILIKGAGGEWHEKGNKFVEKLLGRKKFQPGADTGRPPMMFSSGEDMVVKSIERCIAKHGFYTGIRFVYVAKKDVFSPSTFSGMIGMLKQFSSLNLNGFKPAWNTGVNYFFVKRMEYFKKKKIVRDFRARSYFYPPYRSFTNLNSPFGGQVKQFILNTEELATIYHYPGRTAEVPTLPRIEARKGEPPANLPI